MPANNLNKPLRRDTRQRTRRPSLVAPALIAIAVALGAVAAVWVAVVDDPNGGEPVAVAAVQPAQPTVTGSVSGRAEPHSAPSAAQPLPADSGDAPEIAGLALAPPQSSADPGLVEVSAYGPLPRIAPDGRQPRLAYAGRASAAPAGTARIVIVVGGLGLSQTGTQDAIAALPAGVTLAFAPYGSSLQRWVDKARADGHEVLLQIPLEPADYPNQNPGEHTLLVDDRQKRDQDLEWNLARITSYAGVMNYMGARFTGDENALGSMLGEVGARGLFYLDDGSSAQSRAASLGSSLQVPVVMADRILDAGRSAEAIDRELGALESTARSRGLAIGVASAFPVSVKTIGAWVREAAARGVAVVPASAAVSQ